MSIVHDIDKCAITHGLSCDTVQLMFRDVVVAVPADRTCSEDKARESDAEDSQFADNASSRRRFIEQLDRGTLSALRQLRSTRRAHIR